MHEEKAFQYVAKKNSQAVNKRLPFWATNYLIGINDIVAKIIGWPGCADPTDQSGGGQGDDRTGDDEARKRPRNAPEHDTEVAKGEGEHAEWDGCLAGQDQQDVWHAGQV